MATQEELDALYSPVVSAQANVDATRAAYYANPDGGSTDKYGRSQTYSAYLAANRSYEQAQQDYATNRANLLGLAQTSSSVRSSGGTTTDGPPQQTQIQLLPSSMPMANQYNTMAVAMNAARSNPQSAQSSVTSFVDSGYKTPSQIQNPYAVMTERALPNRPDYTPPAQLGDTQTDRYTSAINQGFAAVNMATGQNFGMSQENTRTAVIGFQMANAQAMNNYRSTQYYGGELQKGAENKVARASEYHYIGKLAGVPIDANPFEYQGDLAVEFLKGAPQSDKERFSPVSGQMSASLPGGGYGLQQYQWDLARGNEKGTLTPSAYNVDFRPATARLINATGEYGPYGSLYGGPEYRGTPSSEGLRMQTPTVFDNTVFNRISAGLASTSGNISSATVQTPTSRILADRVGIIPTSPMGVEMGMAEGSIPKPFRSGGNATTTQNTENETFMGMNIVSISKFDKTQYNPSDDIFAQNKTRLSESWVGGLPVFGSFLGSIPGVVDYQTANFPTSKMTGFVGNIARDAAKTETPNISYNGTEETISYSTGSSNFELFQRGVVDYTYGKILPQTITTNEFAQGMYGYVRNKPFDIAGDTAIFIAGGAAFRATEGVGSIVVAKAATSSLPVISTAGRMASTPMASSTIGIGKAVLGGVILYSAGTNIMSQPTDRLKGETFAKTANEFGAFGAGYTSVSMTTPNNPFMGREYFSGKLGISPTEKLMFKLETGIRSIRTSDSGAYREVATITLPGRVVEPAIKAEPRLDILTTSGKYAPEIKSTLMEQPHSVIGSSSTIQQYPKGIAESTGLRIGKDVDTLIESPSKAIYSLSEKTGLKVLKTPEGKTQIEGGVLDPHPIPQNYPGFKPSTETETVDVGSSILTRMFGDPYRKVAFPRSSSEIITPKTKGYTGELSYEAAQVQFGRKASGVALFVENPTKYGYRGEKDVYDFITTYQAQKQVALSKGTPESAFTKSDIAMKSFMERTFTYGTEKGQNVGDNKPVITRSVNDIYRTMKTENVERIKTFERTRELPVEPKYTVKSDIQRSGVLSSTPSYAISTIPIGSATFISSHGSEQPRRYTLSPPSSPRSSTKSPGSLVKSPSMSNIATSSGFISPSPARSSLIPSPVNSLSPRQPPTSPSVFPSPPRPATTYTPPPSRSEPPTQHPTKTPTPYLIPPPSRSNPPSPTTKIPPPYLIPPPTIVEGGWLPPGGSRGSPQRGYGLRSAVATHPVGADLLGVSRGTVQPMAMPRQRKSKKMGMPTFRMPRF